MGPRDRDPVGGPKATINAVPVDRLQRPLEDLRISVTDRCNFRCTYCMPLDEYDWIARDEILNYEEIARLARIFAGLGVSKLRLTGGEPLVRQDLDRLAALLAGIEGIEDICLTTNGALLAGRAVALRAAGVNRVTISIDSVNPETFAQMTQRAELQPVLEGIAAARQAGFAPIKLNAVIERGVNEREIPDLVAFARAAGCELRFIEYMDVGNANRWTSERLVPKAEILAKIASAQAIEPARRERGSAPSMDYAFTDGGGTVGVVASVTEPFCGACTRARITADGRLVTCLFSTRGHNLKSLLRAGASDGEIRSFVVAVWNARDDRYSEQRLAAIASPQGYRPGAVKKIEMISLGG